MAASQEGGEMIIARSPLRITLGGGGTDLPSYYREHGGFVVSAAIDKYVYVALHQNFDDDLIVKYSKLERVKDACLLEHPIIRETMAELLMGGHGLEITSMADIPAGTGLGSSGSFTTALLSALLAKQRKAVSREALAELACKIELDRLKEPIGKQDQYIAAVGGVTAFTFHKDGSVDHRPVPLSEETLWNLEENLLLFFTGYSRSASAILKDQDAECRANGLVMLANLHTVKQRGECAMRTLEAGDLHSFAELMHHHWQEKRVRSRGMSWPHIDELYAHGLANGALGGKLVGAGGGGFLMFYASDKQKLRHAMRQKGLQEVRFRFDFEGTKIVAS
jgi:D-glycero-alpha-D-manno-heptose-7-phosphate kinase